MDTNRLKSNKHIVFSHQNNQQLMDLKMQLLTSRFTFLLLLSSVCILYLFISLLLVNTSNPYHSSPQPHHVPTTLHHLFFGIGANKNTWVSRKEYVKLWWKPRQMRGCVFVDSLQDDADTSPNDNASLPPLCVSEDTSRFRYTNRGGHPSAIRLARVVLETVNMNHYDVRWYVFGDDDTVFFPENLAKTLSKYDHELWYYVGANSETSEQNREFGFGMAFGGAGFALSCPLAKALAKVFDSCLHRYPHLYGSASRVHSCLAELGIGLTHEPGFHQFDVRGDAFGLLAAHPLKPLVSLHHIDHINPIFPNMTAVNALTHLYEAAKVDSDRILQQSVCYDRWFSWTISVSWGYAVQVFGYHLFLPDALPAQQTFRPWKGNDGLAYSFDIKQPHADPCRRPTIFFLDTLSSSGRNGVRSIYKKHYENCSYDMASPRKLEEIRVFSDKLRLGIKQLQAPRRHCCDVLPSSTGKVMEISIRECKEDELIHMHV